MKMILFDIDGTLLLAGGAGRIAFERVFHHHFSISNAWGKTRPDGKTDPQIVEEIFERTLGRKPTTVEHQHIQTEYCRYFAEEIHLSERFRVLPGIPELLKKLEEHSNIFMGLATGNYEKTSWMKLKKAGLDNHFSFGGYGSDSILRSDLVLAAANRGRAQAHESIDDRDIWVVGDSIYDIRAARKLGYNALAVATGSTSKQSLLAESPNYVLEDLSRPEAFLKLLE